MKREICCVAHVDGWFCRGSNWFESTKLAHVCDCESCK